MDFERVLVSRVPWLETATGQRLMAAKTMVQLAGADYEQLMLFTFQNPAALAQVHRFLSR
jgi:hypothetical protein